MKYTVTDVTPAYFIDPEVGRSHEVSFADPGCELWPVEGVEDKTGTFLPFSGVLRGIKFNRVWIKKTDVVPW